MEEPGRDEADQVRAASRRSRRGTRSRAATSASRASRSVGQSCIAARGRTAAMATASRGHAAQPGRRPPRRALGQRPEPQQRHADLGAGTRAGNGPARPGAPAPRPAGTASGACPRPATIEPGQPPGPGHPAPGRVAPLVRQVDQEEPATPTRRTPPAPTRPARPRTAAPPSTPRARPRACAAPGSPRTPPRSAAGRRGARWGG